jgi:hypothetical protein
MRNQPSRRANLRPTVEGLESRRLLDAGHVPRSFLFRPIDESVPLAEHIHVQLKILIDGRTRVIPAGVGLGASYALPMHTHDATGRLHVESNKVLPFRLRDFFTIWGKPFGPKQVLAQKADRQHTITMTVDGRPSREFGNLLLRDGQQIVVRITTIKPRAR